jgi:ParB family chromosome partitioning protein
MRFDQAKMREPDESLKDTLAARPQFVHRASVFNEKNRAEIAYIPIEKLKPFRHQGRKSFSEQELENLADTIREHGIRQPLTVLRVETEEEGIVFEVVSGERRLRAARMVELSVIPCIVIDDEKKAEELAVIENIQRADLHPVEMAHSIRKLVDSHGPGSQGMVGKKLGMGRSKISELLQLTNLSEEVQNFMIEKNFRERDPIREIFKLKTDAQKLSFIEAHTKPIELATEEEKKIIAKKPQTVFRLLLSGDEFKMQKSKMAQLSADQKEEMIILLSQILEELRTDQEETL